MTQYQLPPPPPDLPQQRWFQLLYTRILAANIGAIAWLGLDFSLSNLTSIATRHHDDLQAITGGGVGDRQHLTTAQVAQLAADTSAVAAHTAQLAGLAGGLNTTITTAKLTTGGTAGSMTFTNGVLTAQTPAT
jgi:hypothetical protein